MNDEELDRRFRALPREIAPPVGLWSAVATRLGEQEATRSESRWRAVAIRVAAGLVIFLSGATAGAWMSAPSTEPLHGDPPFLAAIRVQQAGSALVRATMELEATAALTPGSAATVAQGREVVHSTIELLSRRVAGP